MATRWIIAILVKIAICHLVIDAAEAVVKHAPKTFVVDAAKHVKDVTVINVMIA